MKVLVADNNSSNKWFWVMWASLFGIAMLLQYMGLLHTPSHYHDFADNRAFLSINNTLDVLSNLPFLFVGLWGALYLKQYNNNNINSWFIVIGSMLVCFGSGFYHLAPDNYRLLWDRLPISLVFSGIFMYAVYSLKLTTIPEKTLSITYAMFSICTVFLWYAGEVNGASWLGPYVFLQFGGIILLLYMAYVAYKRGNKNLTKAIVITMLCYVAAKVCETFDPVILMHTSSIISGHTIKHILSAYALYMFIKKTTLV